jgi:hypothetical protein
MTASNQPPAVWNSAVGKVVDVATYSPSKLYRRAIGWMFAAVLVFLLGTTVARDGNDQGAYVVAFGLPPFLLIAACRRFLAAKNTTCYFRAGPGGISARVLGVPLPLLCWRATDYNIPWSSVSQWYPHIMQYNWHNESTIECCDVSGRLLAKISTDNFAESCEEIVKRIVATRNMDIFLNDA